MKNLSSQLTKESNKKVTEFKVALKELKTIESLQNNWYINKFITAAMLKKYSSVTELKSVILDKKTKEVEKDLLSELHKIRAVVIAPELVSIKIVIEWKKNRTWGANPTAEAWFLYRGPNGSETEYTNSGSIGGCGYDKLSTAVSRVLNESNAVLKLLYNEKNKMKNKGLKNQDIFGYGSGYGILPNIEGGVGVSCYPTIFEKLGFKFETTASGKMFDAYLITKK